MEGERDHPTDSTLAQLLTVSSAWVQKLSMFKCSLCFKGRHHCPHPPCSLSGSNYTHLPLFYLITSGHSLPVISILHPCWTINFLFMPLIQTQCREEARRPNYYALVFAETASCRPRLQDLSYYIDLPAHTHACKWVLILHTHTHLCIYIYGYTLGCFCTAHLLRKCGVVCQCKCTVCVSSCESYSRNSSVFLI